MTDFLKYKSQLEQSSCFSWVMLNEIKGENGNILEFSKHSFLADIYDDWTPLQVERKASQIGSSTMKVVKTLWASKYKKYNIIYTLPSFSAVNQFVPSKVNAIISQNPILQDWTKDKDTILQKKVGDNFIYYRGAVSGKASQDKSESSVGIMFSADLLCADECDRSDQFILEQYESRLQFSEYRGRWYFSNPTHPNTLSQKLWERSDQKHWFIKCSRCNEWQYLDFPDSIRDNQFVCKKCGRPLSEHDRTHGEWIKKYQNREVSGYWINQLMASWHSASEIQEQYDTKSRSYFYNFIMGLPYRGSDITIDKDVILNCIDRTQPNFLEGNVMGCDSGLKKHYVIGNKQGIFKVGIADTWEEIELLIKKYDIRSAVIDALPDLTAPRKLQKKYLGIIWLAYFKKEIKSTEYIKWDKKTYTVYVDRSKMFGYTIDRLVERKIKFQMLPEDLELFIKHWNQPYKTKIVNSLDIEEEIWDSSGEDHLALATLYQELALLKSGGGEIEILGGKKKESVNEAPSIKKMIKSQNKKDWRV